MKYWEIIADRLSKAGWSLGWVSAIDSQGRTIWIADAHRDDGNRFIVYAGESLGSSRMSSGSPTSRSRSIDKEVAWLFR